MFLETVFPPIPSEVIMPLAGVRAATGRMTLSGVRRRDRRRDVGNFFWYWSRA